MHNFKNPAGGSFGQIGDPEDSPVLVPLEDPANTVQQRLDPEDSPVLVPLEDPSTRLGPPSTRLGQATLPGAAAAAVDNIATGPRSHEFPVPEAEYSGSIIIRLRKQHTLADADTLQQLLSESLEHQRAQLSWPYRLLAAKTEEESDLQSVVSLLRSEKGRPRNLVNLPRYGPEYHRDSQQRILELEERASKTPWPPSHSLAAYRRVDARHLPAAAAERAISLLNDLVWVDLAYRELAANDPQSADAFAQHQHYLDRAPVGIGASWARPLTNGQRVDAVDLEQGWVANDELWDDGIPALLHGNNRHQANGQGPDTYRGHHGTAVVGQLAASRNSSGIEGVAPGSQVHLLSHFLAGQGAGNVADAITAAVDDLTEGTTLQPGDVLLVEVQRGFLPAEVDPADFAAIRLATAHGLIVVAAAGNGGFDLDSYRDPSGRAVLDRRRGGFRDSGAILVGASRSRYPNDRARFSNYGSRLDCFACGEGVVTTGYGDLDDRQNNAHTQTFGGTSSAVPIVAGAALILQNIHQSKAGQRLSPSQMRAILADRTTGTRQGGGVAGHIGVMPDLGAICKSLALDPRVYLRAHLGDDGDGLSGHVTCSSPDLEVAVDGSITLQLRNYGLATTEAEATVYQLPLSTLILPTTANRIGGTPKIDVPAGNQPHAVGLDHQASTADASFLAVLDYCQDPTPALPPPRPYFRWREFLSFNRQHAKRSIVEDANPSSRLYFCIVGAADRPRVFDFEILQSMPPGTEVTLRVPRHLAARLWNDRLPPAQPATDPPGMDLQLPRAPRLGFPAVQLAAEPPYIASFTVTLPQGTAAGSSLVIRQLFEGEEVGRITWRLAQQPS